MSQDQSLKFATNNPHKEAPYPQAHGAHNVAKESGSPQGEFSESKCATETAKELNDALGALANIQNALKGASAQLTAGRADD